ncbi:MAG: hypothetical protein H6741_02700 [Alphaproteobacteria bacterium]|nr:hypothetical protein [Alphaproteobacteria bacterium]MCB9791614.1 hypothetical protein [Alphaproteobacteria bacterium]
MSGAAARWTFSLAIATPPLAFGAAALTRPLQDPDLFWLMEGGRRLLAEGLTLDNGWSWTAPTHPWVLHEPLTALAYHALGWAGLPWLRWAILSALLLGLLRLASGRGAWAASLGLCCALPLVSVGLSERAMATGALVWTATLLSLRPWSGEPVSRARGALAAALVVLGSTLHGAYLLGLALLALYAWPWALVAGAGAALLPGGLDRAALLLGYAGQSETLHLAHGYVHEWTPLWPEDAAWALRLALALLGVGAMLDRGGWRARLLALLLLGLALRHRRFVLELGIAVTPWLVAWLGERLPRRDEGPALQLTALGLLTLALGTPPGLPDLDRYPPGALGLAQPALRTWSDLPLGAWLASQGQPVFWDARNDCYPPEVYADGLRIATQAEDWTWTLELWRVEQVLTTDPELASGLQALGWSEIGQAGSPPVRVLQSRSAVDRLSPN